MDQAGTGTGTVAAGALTVDGARVNADPTYAPGRVLEFRATFGSAEFQHVGLGTDFNGGPWAMFSTGGGTLPTGLWARTLSAATGGTTVDTRIDGGTNGVDPLAPHTYRIEWTATDVKFYVDGALVATHTAVIAGPMRPVASDFTAGGPSVKVDWLGMAPYPATGSGTFTSRVLDALDTRAVWGSLVADATTPAGTTVSFETRSGDTAAPDASWSTFQPLGSGGKIQSPSGRYIQYRATLSTTDTAATPTLHGVTIGYDIDSVAPSVAIGGVAVSGTTATLTFTSSATDVASFQCRLDGGQYATCTSPERFSGLAPGLHTAYVRAVDRAGNVGAPASHTFRIVKPAGDGSGGVQGETEDRLAPNIGISHRSLRASRRGVVKLRLRCPATEERCMITVRVKYHGRTVARKHVTLDGGEKAKVSLRLSKAARRLLTAQRRLKVRAVVKARDAAGNTKTKRVRLVLRAPAL